MKKNKQKNKKKHFHGVLFPAWITGETKPEHKTLSQATGQEGELDLASPFGTTFWNGTCSIFNRIQ
jgi:hypothetical protein